VVVGGLSAFRDFGVVGIYLLTSLLLRHPMNRFDARLSMRRAFSFGELRTAAIAARVSRDLATAGFPVSRQASWLEKEALA